MSSVIVESILTPPLPYSTFDGQGGQGSSSSQDINTTPRVSRSVVQSVLARETSEGVGATVRRSIGSQSLRNLTPFLMLDYAGLAPGAGFPDHPHRGMTTLSYLLKGEVAHEDSAGHKGKLGPGDVQFMIAGRGIMHSEMPVHKPGGDDPLALQLWIDLPKEHKLVKPSYQELTATEISSVHPSPNVLVKVICGKAEGNAGEGMVESPVRPLGGCWFFDVTFSAKGEKFWQAIPAGWNAFVFIMEGNALIGPSSNSLTPIKTFHTSVLSGIDGESGVQIESATDKVRLVVAAGEPLQQKIFQHGPFVMDTQEGIMQAFKDYRDGKNGFEGAAEWRSIQGARLRSG